VPETLPPPGEPHGEPPYTEYESQIIEQWGEGDMGKGMVKTYREKRQPPPEKPSTTRSILERFTKKK